eukprot:5147268-Amphidinium_carterae.1
MDEGVAAGLSLFKAACYETVLYQELELKPGASLGWFLVPVKSGTRCDFQLKCTVAGHTEGGMVGRVMVAPRTV